MSAGAVRAGGVFVEIGADPRKFFSALTKVNKSLGNMGRSLASGGGRLAAAGIGMAAPIAAAVQQGAAFESTLLNIRASTGATAAQIDQIKASSMAMSQALGVGPTEAAQGMLELLKAGMSLDAVLGGAGQTAMEFAKVGEMDVAQAAVVMSDAMNVFKVSSGVAANALSSAADASSTSIAEMSQAFSMSSAVAGKAGLSIEDLSGTLAILANNGVKGSDAGTSIKTMLMRLMAPASEAADAMAGVGLSVRSFVNQDTGKMLPMVDIIGKLGEAMKPLDEVAKKELLAKIFGADAIRAALILGDVGVAGFEGIQKAMASALPVGEKYKILMQGLAGSAGNVLAALQRMAIAVSDAVAPALAGALPFITGFIDGLTKLATDNKEAVVLFAQVAAAAIGIGAAMVTVGYALQALSGSIGLVLKGFGLFSALASPVLLVAAGIGAAVFALYKFKDQIGAALGPVAPLVQQAAGAIGEGFGAAVSDGIVALGDLATTATTTFNGVYEAVAAGDLSGAMDVLWAGLVAGWLRGTEAFMSYVDPWVAAFQDVFTDIGSGIVIAWDKIYTDSAALLNTMGAFIMGFFDNIANGVMATFDNLVAGIQIAWTRVQGFITGAKDTEQRVQDIKDENAARAEQRMQERPGVNARTDKAAAENAQAEKDRKDREQAIKDDAQATKDERPAANAQRAADRRAATQAAEGNLANVMSGKDEGRKDATVAAELLTALGSASSLEEITNIGASMDALIQRGNVGGEVESKLLDAYYAAFSRVNVASAASSSSEKAATAGAGAAGADAATSKSEVAGTFSSANLGGMGFGSSLAERTAKAAEETAKNTRKIDDGGKVAA
jgi:TP901 family phage tail tape measure protein